MHFWYIQLRAFFRFVQFLCYLSAYFVSASYVYLTTPDPIRRRHRLTENGSKYARLMLNGFNVELICKNPISADEQCLLVGNHVGFIDIVCLVAIQPAVFITSTDMKNTPLLGQICDLGGCTYVNRRSRMKIHDELKDVVNVLKQGFRVVLYAESVASNGEQVLPFKKTLMMSAGIAQKPIRPFVFNFRKANNEPVRFEHRDHLCWYGDQTFLPAIWRSLQLDSAVCEIEFLPLVHATEDDNRTEVANRVHKMVSEKYNPFVAPGLTTHEAPQSLVLD